MALPNVNVNVGEQTLVASNTVIPFVPAIIMKTKSGPIGTVETITSESQFKAIFGESDFTTPSAYAIQVYLRSYSYILVTRVANENTAALGTGKLSFINNSDTVDLLSVETNYKTDLYNGKELKLVYDSVNNKIWLDATSVAGKSLISVKEDFTADTVKADAFEIILNKLVNSINSSNIGIKLTNLFTNKTELDPMPTVDDFTNGISTFISEGDSGNTSNVEVEKVKELLNLYDTTALNVDVLSIPEYNNFEVVNHATYLALNNNFVVLASPTANTVQEAIGYVSNYDKDNRGSLAVYFPDVYYSNFKDNAGKDVQIPACIAVLNTYARTDSINKWSAPAGVIRGKLSLVKGLSVQLTDTDLSTLYDNIVPINGINDISGKGFIVWGNKTTSSNSPFFDRVNVSRLTKYITKQAFLISWDYLFEPITTTLFADWKMKIESLLNKIQIGYGLDEYVVIMDSTINTPETIAKNQLNGIIRIKPTEVAEYITIDFTIADTINVVVEE